MDLLFLFIAAWSMFFLTLAVHELGRIARALEDRSDS